MMDIIICIIIFTSGVTMGLMISLILWQKMISDSMTKFDIEIAKLQADLETYKDNESEVEDGNR